MTRTGQRLSTGDAAAGEFTALVPLAQNGCRQAMDRLLQDWYPRHYPRARYWLGDGADAHDAVQEAAIKISRKLHQLACPEAFPGWSNTILRRCCIQLIHQREKRNRLHVDIDNENLALESCQPVGERVDDLIWLSELCHRLGDWAAEVIRLRLYIGLSNRETAAVLGISEPAVKVRLFRARREALRLMRRVI